MDVRDSNFRSASFSTRTYGSELRGGEIATCDLLQAVFERTNLKKADFRAAEQWTIDPAVNQVKGLLSEGAQRAPSAMGLDLRDD